MLVSWYVCVFFLFFSLPNGQKKRKGGFSPVGRETYTHRETLSTHPPPLGQKKTSRKLKGGKGVCRAIVFFFFFFCPKGRKEKFAQQTKGPNFEKAN